MGKIGGLQHLQQLGLNLTSAQRQAILDFLSLSSENRKVVLDTIVKNAAIAKGM
ncbi:hypothetical protein L914_07002, partial [Phytophthora nicotianae]